MTEMEPGNLNRLIRKGLDTLLEASQIKATVPEYLKALQLIEDLEPHRPADRKCSWREPVWMVKT